jgi:hypothetical protein
MKKTNKILFGIFIMTLFFTMYTSPFVAAAPTPDTEVSGDTYQNRILAHEQTTLRFRQRTMLTFNANVNLDVDINCAAMNIGVKDVQVEITTTSDMQMNMTCTEEETELGLLLGNTNQVRNRNRHTYQEGFVFALECNLTNFQAKLKIGLTDENRGSTWAYYDEAQQEWVPVTTIEEDGYLVCETSHFSTWTILMPELDWTLIIVGATIGAAVIIGVIVIVMKRRK